MNLKHENTIVHAENNKSEISRKVTEIDYGKHEKTVKELDRQEKEQEYQRKATEAAQWCTLDHEHGPNCKRPPTSCSQDHQKEWQIYERSTEEKIAAAERFRQEGNEAYRRRNFGLAAVHYRRALLHFDYTFAETEDLQNQVDAVKLPCLLNLAACKCQQEDWDEVLTQCRQALEINPRAVKAHYRVGLAYLARDEFELAKDALTSAHEIEPSNPDIAAALKQLKKNMEDYKTRRRDVAKEMLSGKEQAPDVAEQATEQPADVSGAETQEVAHSELPPESRETPAAAGLRRRRGSKGAKPAEDDEEDDEVEKRQSTLQCLLVTAVGLGVLSVTALVVSLMST